MADVDREVADVLRGAATLLERDGWLGSPSGMPRGPEPCCIWQAVAKTARKRYTAEAGAVDALLAHLGLHQLSDLWDWNDMFGRTREEAVAALTETAEILEAMP